MFSTCSELSPHAPIPDGRMERFMHPVCKYFRHQGRDKRSESSSLSSEQYYCKTHLLYDDIAGQKERDCDPDDEENIVPPFLWAPPHELLVVDAEEEADGEEGEEAAVEHLGHEDHHEAINWEKKGSN